MKLRYWVLLQLVMVFAVHAGGKHPESFAAQIEGFSKVQEEQRELDRERLLKIHEIHRGLVRQLKDVLVVKYPGQMLENMVDENDLYCFLELNKKFQLGNVSDREESVYLESQKLLRDVINARWPNMLQLLMGNNIGDWVGNQDLKTVADKLCSPSSEDDFVINYFLITSFLFDRFVTLAPDFKSVLEEIRALYVMQHPMAFMRMSLAAQWCQGNGNSELSDTDFKGISKAKDQQRELDEECLLKIQAIHRSLVRQLKDVLVVKYPGQMLEDIADENNIYCFLELSKKFQLGNISDAEETVYLESQKLLRDMINTSSPNLLPMLMGNHIDMQEIKNLMTQLLSPSREEDFAILYVLKTNVLAERLASIVPDYESGLVNIGALYVLDPSGFFDFIDELSSHYE